MRPKLRLTNISAAPLTHGVNPRCIQKSGIFRLPAELILGILAYFGDPHRNILHEKSGRYGSLEPKAVERLTVIRRLTMTCWHLRNRLLPVLWKHVEGCNMYLKHRSHGPHMTSRLGGGLYAQCSYLLLNPTIGVYVETLSVDLYFKHAPKDLMSKFIDCLVRLPNLRTLEVFSTSHLSPIPRGLKRKSAKFPSVRELAIGDRTAKFIGSCPNVETVTAPIQLSLGGANVLSSYGKELEKLKRVVGVSEDGVRVVAQGCPDLQEIGIRASSGIVYRTSEASAKIVKSLRSLKRLAVVELDYDTHLFSSDELDEIGREVYKDGRDGYIKEWKRLLIPVLKDSHSQERKFLRWTHSENHWYRYPSNGITDVVENGELEVFPTTSLIV
ncbi:hypothetical protein BJ322DRAFT_182548 [Thelephora terrestris]|uniref:F-box domain-containing protein n=1 Tax=Thelephora terrestris TaxID=56493 RepID=A0A9P6L517_9AGAM|nr:hypothetical protein BJ322DRAFT_182548 [Thelephora terrestris]